MRINGGNSSMKNSWPHIIGSMGEDDHGLVSFLSAYHVGLDIVLGLRLSGEIFVIALQCIKSLHLGSAHFPSRLPSIPVFLLVVCKFRFPLRVESI